MSDLLARARAWLADDPDEQTKGELARLIRTAETDAEARDELAERFSGPLEFGTAGLRGALGAGPHRMNRAVVLRAAAGLAAYLREQGYLGGTVVIGYDARHRSDDFAADTARVMTGAGFDAVLLPRPLPTPVLAFAIGDRHAVAGVMVTASHNPPEDNGYKVYLGDGSQIVPPADAEIAAQIAAVGAVAELPLGQPGIVADEGLVERYLASVNALLEPGPRDLALVYTPLHGVGCDTVLSALAGAGFDTPRVVEEQRRPDPDFPTVAFPNPEEAGAMDLALALADETGVDLVVANDPDADRCAAAVPGPHGWRMLQGDEVGALLAHHLLRRGRRGTYAASIVSSSLLGEMAQAAGQPHAETLTGFKWISRVPGLTFGYEEALGYCVDPTRVRDKDGVSALLLLCELAAQEKAMGRSLVDVLDDLARTHGLHATAQLSVRVDDVALIEQAMSRLRSDPPAELGGLPVSSVEDLATGSADLPPTEGLRYRLPGARVVVRPSGTEPKLKCYLEVVVPVETAAAHVPDSDDDVDAARIAAAGRLDAVRADLQRVLGL